MKTRIILLLMISGIVDCSDLFGQDKVYQPEKRKNRKITEEEIKLEFYPIDELRFVPQSAAIAAIIPPVAEAGTTITKYILEKKEEKFSADYKASISDDEFFKADQKPNLRGLEFTRSFKFKNGSSEVEGLKIKLRPQISSDGTAFRYGVEYFKLDFSKAKAVNSGDYINFNIEVELDGLLEKENEIANRQIGKVNIDLKGVPFGKVHINVQGDFDTNISHWSSWIPLPNFDLRMDIAEPSLITKQDGEKVALDKGWDIKTLIERGWFKLDSEHSHFTRYLLIGDKYYSQVGSRQPGGNFSIEVSIKEVNPRIIKSQKAKEFFEENSEALNDVISVVVENTFESPEESSTEEVSDEDQPDED